MYELFAMERGVGVELLVRASWNRVVDSAHRYLWETMQAAPVLGAVEVSVPRKPGEPVRRCAMRRRFRRVGNSAELFVRFGRLIG